MTRTGLLVTTPRCHYGDELNRAVIRSRINWSCISVGKR